MVDEPVEDFRRPDAVQEEDMDSELVLTAKWEEIEVLIFYKAFVVVSVAESRRRIKYNGGKHIAHKYAVGHHFQGLHLQGAFLRQRVCELAEPRLFRADIGAK